MEPITITLPGWNQISTYFAPPDSTDDVIIFPFNSESQKFSRTVDSTKITQGKTSLDDINDALTIFELVFGRVTSTKKFLVGFVFPFLIPYILFMYYYWFYGGFAETVRYGALVFALIIGTKCLYKRMRETGRSKVDIQRMIEMIRPVYAKRGLAWHFSENFFCSWLELKKEGEVHSSNNKESLISQERILEELKDEDNIIVCAAKNLTDPDFSPPVQFKYVILMIIYGYVMISWMNSLCSFSHFYYHYF